jgi:translocation and assembly module TamA
MREPMIRHDRHKIRYLLWIAPAFVLSPACVRAANPQPYKVIFKPSGDKKLDSLLKATSDLATLRKKLPVGPFALIGRAEADEKKFITVLQSLGYDSGSTRITIEGHALSDPALPGLLRRAPKAPPVPITVTPDKGPLYHLSAIDTQGLTMPAARPALGIKTGQPALATPIVAAGPKLETTLKNDGYAFAKVGSAIAIADTKRHTLAVRYPVSMGPRVDIGAIRFQGMTRMREAFLRRHLALKPGQPFSETALQKARDSLLGLNVFSSVTTSSATTTTPGQPLPRVPITFIVHEQKLHAVSVGAAYSTDLGITGDLSWMDRDLFGGAQRLTLSAGATGIGSSGSNRRKLAGKNAYLIEPGYNVKALYEQPDFLRREQTLSAQIEALKEYLPAYSRTGALADLLLTRPLTPHLTLSFGAGFIAERVLQEGIRRNYVLGQIPLILKYDTADSRFNPTHGVRLSLRVTPTASLEGGSGAFVITEAIGNTYINLEAPGRGILAVRGLVGRIFGGSQFQVPPDQRFYAGGTGTVRGYTYQTVGPLFADGIPAGGTAIDATEIEFRQRIGKTFGIAPFIDAGQVSATGTPFTGTLRVGTGLGFLYYTGIGPIRLDVGVPLERPPGGASLAVYIGLGQAF